MKNAVSGCVPALPSGGAPLETDGGKQVQKSSFPLSQDGRKCAMEKKDGEGNNENVWNGEVRHVFVRGVSF